MGSELPLFPGLSIFSRPVVLLLENYPDIKIPTSFYSVWFFLL